jgi:H+/gluconate symporter-like permease
VAVIGSGTLDSLPHNGAVVTLLAVCGSTHRESYFDIFVVAIAGAMIALAVPFVFGILLLIEGVALIIYAFRVKG